MCWQKGNWELCDYILLRCIFELQCAHSASSIKLPVSNTFNIRCLTLLGVVTGRVFTGCFPRQHPKILPKTLTSTPSTLGLDTPTSTAATFGRTRWEGGCLTHFLTPCGFELMDNHFSLHRCPRCVIYTSEESSAPALWSVLLPYAGLSIWADEVGLAGQYWLFPCAYEWRLESIEEEPLFIYATNVTDKSFLSGSFFNLCLPLFSFSHYKNSKKKSFCWPKTDTKLKHSS